MQIEQASGGRQAQLPLPIEVIEQIIQHLSIPSSFGDPASQKALVSLSAVNRIFRFLALSALYQVVVLPRHVRDFRKWIERVKLDDQHQTRFRCAGHTRALFSGLDDVSRITYQSAGWESQLLRLLHHCGSTLTHLSLWNAESRVVLRDPSQVRGGRRFGVEQPLWSWGENEARDVLDDEERQRAEAAEAEAASEREKADMPRWLRAEFERKGPSEVWKSHAAHVMPDRIKRATSKGCRPTHLSIVIALPIFENEDREIFGRMVIWTRVEELDVHVPTPSQVVPVLRLLSTLHRSPLRRLRVSSVHASLSICVLDDRCQVHDQGHRPNVARVLSQLVEKEPTREAIKYEFSGRFADDVQKLQSSLVRHALDQDAVTNGSLKIKVRQGNQGVWGKLKDRLWDFQERVHSLSDGAWDLT
ncbi:hypothetical protein IE53DRAFT_35083 [Violaceomyces palustris]|uniref:Uncharacterized protein n=1 Tax=Violaceomyces palustris TaxID=1673888 RepID=A0ACD0P0Z8_9BASI|nr:hypothetical protein IE53DRAFT_35083 [Violaceomyces palustris]